MKWIDSEEQIKPARLRPIIVYCPEWSLSGYQVCYWDGKVFRYDEQPNNDFHSYVTMWSIFLEVN